MISITAMLSLNFLFGFEITKLPFTKDKLSNIIMVVSSLRSFPVTLQSYLPCTNAAGKFVVDDDVPKSLSTHFFYKKVLK